MTKIIHIYRPLDMKGQITFHIQESDILVAVHITMHTTIDLLQVFTQ